MTADALPQTYYKKKKDTFNITSIIIICIMVAVGAKFTRLPPKQCLNIQLFFRPPQKNMSYLLYII